MNARTLGSPELCPVCDRIIETDHQVDILDHANRLTAAGAARLERELGRLLDTPAALDETFVAHRVNVLEARFAHWLDRMAVSA